MTGSFATRRSVKIISRCILVAIIAAAIWFILQSGGEWLQQIESFSWNPVWPLLAVSCLLLAVSYYLIPYGWTVLARKAGCEAGSRELRSIWFISQLGRYIPGKIWLFAGRAAFLKRSGLSGFRATSVPFLELLFTAAGAGLAALPVALVYKGSVFANPSLRVAVIAAGCSMLIIPFLRPLQRSLYRIRHGQVPEELPLPGPGASMGLVLVYCVLWWSRGVCLYFWITGFGIQDVSLTVCLAAAPLSWLAGYVVFLVPGGIGIREAVVTAMLAPYGQTGPILAVIAGQRLILSVIEVSFALAGAGRTKLIRKGGHR